MPKEGETMLERLELVTRELDQVDFNDVDRDLWYYVDEIYHSIEMAIRALEDVRDDIC